MRPSPPPPVDPDLAGLFASRGRIDADRYLQTRDGHDLEDAISNMRTAVTLAKETQSSILGPALGNLASLSLEHFKSTGKDASLNEARQLATWALECLSDGDADRAIVLATLGNILASQYDRSGGFQDLEEAVSSLRIANQARSPSDNSTFPAVVLNNLACVLGMRYEITGRREDLDGAVTSALEATKVGLSDSSLMAGAGSTLASLLVRQCKFTGMLNSLADALFELRIVTEMAPEFPELDTLLSQLGSLAMEQHALRASETDENMEVLRSFYPSSLTLFLLLFLSTVVSVFFPGAFYPLVVFFGGMMSNWAFQEYYHQITSVDKPGYLLHFIPTWVLKIFSSPYDTTRFAPTLFPTPWIDNPSTLTLPKSEEEPYNEDILRRQASIHATRLESGFDPGRRNGARNRCPAQDTFSTIKCYMNGLESQGQLLYDHLVDSKIWDDASDSSSDSEPSETLCSASEEGGNVNQIDEIEEQETSILTKGISTLEKVKTTLMEITYPTESTTAWEKQETISDTIPVSVGHPPKQTVTEAVLPIDSEDDIMNPTKQVQDDASEKQYKPPSTELSPFEAKSEALTTPNQRHTSHRDIQLAEDADSALGKDFIDQKVHSRMSPTKLDKESSAFDSVAQGNTSNEINKNEGNAMGNIYSEEAHVVGHLSRHYGDRFETKNISAVLPWYNKPDADRNPPDTAFDELHTEDIPQEVIRGIRESESVEPRLRQLQTENPTLEHEAEQDKSRSKKKQDARRTKRHRDMDSKDYFSNGRFAEPKTKRETKQPGKFDVSPWSKTLDPYRASEVGEGRDLLPAPVGSNAPTYDGYSSRNARRKHLDHERDMGTPQIPRRQGHERLRNTLIDNSSNEARSEFDSKVSSLRGKLYGEMPLQPSPDWYMPNNDLPVQVIAQDRNMRSKRIVPSQPIAPTQPKRGTKEEVTVERSTGLLISVPPPAPNLKSFESSLEQVQALSFYLQSTLLPLCTEYIRNVLNVPTDQKTREWAHRKLSETIMTQVLLQADGIEVNDEATRTLRRKLVKDAQSALKNLDSTLRDYH